MKIPICPHCKCTLYNNYGPCKNCGQFSLEEVEREATPQEIAEIQNRNRRATIVLVLMFTIVIGSPIAMIILGIYAINKEPENQGENLIGWLLLVIAFKWISGLRSFLLNR